jgi:hypothetical protein
MGIAGRVVSALGATVVVRSTDGGATWAFARRSKR